MIPPASVYARATYDPEAAGTAIGIGVADSLGPTPEGCVELLALRPLLVGAAWKVLDLLYEEALQQHRLAPDRGREYTIKGKQKRARRGTAKPSQFSRLSWNGLTALYANTVELRHSLVHRTARTDASRSLIGMGRAGERLRPLGVNEQEAFGKTALIAAAIACGQQDAREDARLLAHLSVLAPVHRRDLGAPASVPRVVPEITVIVDRQHHEADYLLDIPSIRAWLPFADDRDFVDMIVAPRDRPGQEMRGRLEDAPDQKVMLDPDQPPAWLH